MGTEAVETGSNGIPAIQRLLARTDLTGKTAVMDAVNTQIETARQVVQDCGGDYLLTVKGNQKGLGETLDQLWAGAQAKVLPAAAARPGSFSLSALDVRSGAANGTQQRANGSA
jgi:hypothetical protein